MIRMKSTPSSIHRRLILSLLGVALVLSAALATAVLYTRWNQLGAVVEDRARLASARLASAVGDLLTRGGAGDRGEVQRTVESFANEARRQALGRFVHLRLYDPDLKLLAEYSEEGYPQLSSARGVLDAVKPTRARLQTSSSKLVMLGHEPHLWLTSPVKDASGHVLAFGEGVFAPSAETIWTIRKGAVRTAAAVCGIILLTALILYPVILRLLHRVTSLSLKLLESHLETLKVLGSAIAKRDSDTDAHNFRVTLLSVRIAEALGLQPGEMRALIKGAFLHDVGKIGIPDQILLKPGRLDDGEFAQMKRHVSHGVEIVGRSPWLKDALQVVEHHHEKVDGSGYPHGLAGDRCPAVARIFAVADVFDALTSRRPYKDPLSLEDAMEILRQGRGTHFDAEIFDVFERFAPRAYEEIAGREDHRLRTEVSAIVERYFAEDPEALEL